MQHQIGCASIYCNIPSKTKYHPDPSGNYAVTAELLDLFVARSQNLSKDLVGMLTQKRRRTPNPWRRVGVFDWSIHHFDGPARGVIDLGHHVPSQHYY